MMYAKVLCVLYPLMLGYDVLFQDVGKLFSYLLDSIYKRSCHFTLIPLTLLPDIVWIHIADLQIGSQQYELTYC